MFAELPPHFRLMLLAARMGRSAAEEAELRATAAGPLDWQEFLAVATTHKVATLALAAVAEMVPRPVAEALTAKRELNDQRVVRCALEVRRVAERFAEAGIVLTGLKGLVLSQAFYGDAKARHVGDLDLLTNSNDVAAQIELLRGLGYTVENPQVPLTPRRLTSYQRFWKDMTFRHHETGRLLDLHWRLFNNPAHRGNRLVAPVRGEVVPVLGLPMAGMVAADQFVYAALHGVSDEWVYLKALADVAAFLRSAQPSLVQQALLRAREIGVLPQVSSAVHLAQEWMGASVDSPLLLPASDPLHTRLMERMTGRLLRSAFRPERTRLGALDQARFELRLAPGMRSASEIAMRYAFRPRIWALADLPDRWFWLYPVLGVVVPPRLAPE